ncbi:MAG: response regulator [Verrucomicrobia bacterium]|nr:response regulator [Verrucomicrobiota bacterium]
MSEASKNPPRAHVLVVEDSSVFREMQGLLLHQAGYAVSGHEHPQTALAAARERKYELVIIDYELPEMNGQQFMHELRKILPEIAVIFVSGSLTLELAIKLSREGVAGIFNKPANPKTLLEKINETLSRTGSREAALPGKGSGAPVPDARRGAAPAAPVGPAAGELAYTPRFFPGQCEAFREFTHRLWKVRDFRSALLLQGGPGTPFELIARDLAAISVFREGPVMVCPAAKFETRHLIEVLAPTLLSQDAGTLIVTGVESLSPDQQAVLQTLTSSRDVFLPFARRFRLVLAAACHLSELADAGTFDETLFYKVSSLAVDVPSLRELRGDILLHTRQLLDQFSAAAKSAKSPALSPTAAAWLEEQEWPGNYADLSRTLQLALDAKPGAELGVPALEAALQKVLGDPGRTSVAPAPAPIVRAPVPVEETPPPFSMRATPIVAVKPVTEPSTPAPVPAAAPKVATAPNRPSGLTGRSVFRTVAGAYDFSKRLAESLSVAEAASAP